MAQEFFVRALLLADLFPCEGREKNHHGDDLQSAEQHIEAEQELGKGRIAGEIAHRTDFLETGTDVVETGNGCGHVGLKAEAIDGNQNNGGNQKKHEKSKISDRRADNLLRDGFSIQSDNVDGFRAKHVFDFAERAFTDQYDTGYFESTGRRACARARQHQKQQDALRKRRPQIEVRGRKAARGNDRGDLKECRSDAITGIIKQISRIDENGYGGQQTYNKENAEFLVLFNFMESSDQCTIIKVEVDTEKKHENGDDPLNGRAMVSRDGIVEYGKSTRACC